MDTTMDMLARIEATIDTLRPYIASHKGQVEVVDFDASEGKLYVRLGGTCQAEPRSSRSGIAAPFTQDYRASVYPSGPRCA